MNTSKFLIPFFALSLLVIFGVMASTSTGSLAVLNPVGPQALFWNLAGNSGTNPSTNFLGTTDNKPLVFKTNNVEAMRLGLDGSMMANQVGELAPGAGLTLGSDLRFNNKLRVPSSYLIYTDGTITYALNGQTGKIDFQGLDAAAVIQSTFAPNRHILITTGLYKITSPIDLVDNLTLEMETGAILEVPNGYDGYVFGLKSRPLEQWFGVHNSRITGGWIREERTDAWDPNPPPNPLYPQRKWVAILLLVEHTSGGIYFNTIRDVRIDDPDVAIKMLERAPCGTDEEQVDPRDICWINNNVFDTLLIYAPNTFIEFAVEGVHTHPVMRAFFYQNIFQNIMGQARYSNTLSGVKGVWGQGNMFVGVQFYDIKNPDAVTTSLTPYAKDTIILGGLMTYGNFDDKGWRTQIIDQSLNKQITLDELEIGTSSMTNAFAFRSEDDGLHVKEYHEPGEAMLLTPGGTLTINKLDFQENYELFVGADGLYLEDLTTGTVYRIIMEAIPGQ